MTHPKFGHIEDNGPSDRQRCAPGFSIHPYGESKKEIVHSGRLVVVIHDNEVLPAGFTDRLAQFVMDLCTGKRTELWSEQAIYGPMPRDPEETRRRAFLQADENMRRREGG